MFFRNMKVINKRLQLKFLFKVTGLVLITFFIIIGFVGMNASQNNKMIKLNVLKLKRIIEVENKIVEDKKNEISSKKENNKKMDIEVLTIIKNHLIELENSAEKNIKLFTIILGVIVFFVFILIFYLLRFTHKIAGPIYVMSTYLDDIIEGKELNLRDLRDGDELKEFYEKFTKVIKEIEK